MTTFERTLAALIVLAGLLVVGWLGLMHYGGKRYDAGYAAAVAKGKTARDAAAETTASPRPTCARNCRRATRPHIERNRNIPKI